jgi:hypothetical protein
MPSLLDARKLVRDYHVEETIDEDEEEVLQDARVAIEESTLIEEDPKKYALRVRVQARKIARADNTADGGGDELSNYLNEVTRNRLPMTKEQAMEAARRGDLNALIEGNLLLVVSVALLWRGFNRSVMDMIGEGNVELTKVATRYDVSREFAFSTYAMFSIRYGIRNEALRQDTQYASLPPMARRALGALYVERARLERESGDLISLRETADRLRIRDAQRARRHTWPDDRELVEWLLTTETAYFSQLVRAMNRSPGLSETIADHVAIPSAYDPIEEIDAKLDMEQNAFAWVRDLRALRARNLVTDHDLHLLCLRFGLPHPDTDWTPPDGWEIGHVHSLRWVASKTTHKYEWTRQTLLKLVERLRGSDVKGARRIGNLLTTARPLIRYQGRS